MHVHIAKRDRIWLLGGLIAALLLTALAWEFIISGQYSQTSSLRSQTSDVQSQALQLQHDVAQLHADNANLPKYQAALTAAQQALPANTGMPAFLSELHSVSDVNGVTVVQFQVGSPVAVTPISATASGASGSASTTTKSASVATGPVFELPCSMITTGAELNLEAFLKQLQAQQPRAVLIQSVQEAPSSNAGQVQLSVTFQVFVAPSDGGTPATN